MRLNGSAGTGKKILSNWNLFSYSFEKKEVCHTGTEETYFFKFQFDKQVGNAVIKRKLNEVGEWYIDEGTLFDSTSFKRPLGAYNDTTYFNDGLYKVSERMVNDIVT
ncbi:hypothetical protein [Fusibacter sp. JL216-2]|uniref:hypothetical protein n=1 Tax=Fusibacter sp. JL216-2 TaxID=3071453 RepID=UPI003D349C04